MKLAPAVVVLFLLAACSSSDPSNGDDTGDSDSDQVTDLDLGDTDEMPLPECTAQRLVHLVGGNGGLASFTLVWPVPAIITNPNPSYAYDDTSKAQRVVDDAVHPLYARYGALPDTTVLVGYANETHTNSPQAMIEGSTDIVAAGAKAQAGFAAPLPVVLFRPGAVGDLQYTPVTDGPNAVHVVTIADAIDALAAAGADTGDIANVVNDRVAAWGIDASQTAPVILNFAQRLAFTSVVLERNLSTTVIVSALNDDPHNLFDTDQATARADAVTNILVKFRAQLASVNEGSCGTGTSAISVADNTVVLVTGDTPKNPFNKSGWSDASVVTWAYVGSNGFLKPGWFGQVTAAGSYAYNVDTGATLATTNFAADRTAGRLGILYAITRGNAELVSAFSTASYQGLVKPR